MFVKKNRKRGRPLLRKRTYKKKSVTKPSAMVRKYVKRVVNSQIEDKRIVIERAQTFGSILQDATLGAFPVGAPLTSLFVIPLGTTQSTRIGNTIKCRRVMLRYVLRPTTYQAGVNDNPQPAHILMMLGNYKQYKGVLPTNIEVGQLYDTGAGSSAPAGDLSDLIQPINKDAWDIKKKWSHKVGNAQFTGPGNLQNFGFFANNDFQLNVVRSLDITKYCPKTVKFNDAGATNQGPNLFFMYQAIMTNGGVFPATQRPFAIDYWIDYTYQDA